MLPFPPHLATMARKRGAGAEMESPVGHPPTHEWDQKALLRPESRLNNTTMTARTSRRWINPPKLVELTTPSNHKAARITTIVQSIMPPWLVGADVQPTSCMRSKSRARAANWGKKSSRFAVCGAGGRRVSAAPTYFLQSATRMVMPKGMDRR